jgi:hypothetical protein
VPKSRDDWRSGKRFSTASFDPLCVDKVSHVLLFQLSPLLEELFQSQHHRFDNDPPESMNVEIQIARPSMAVTVDRKEG